MHLHSPLRRSSRFLSISLPTSLLQRTAQEKLDLSVQTAQVVACPPLHGFQDCPVYP
jgi:hypothetical protein